MIVFGIGVLVGAAGMFLFFLIYAVLHMAGEDQYAHPDSWIADN